MQSNNGLTNTNIVTSHSYNDIQYEDAHPLPDLSDMLLSNETLCAMVDNPTTGGAVCQVMGQCDVTYTALLQDNNNEHTYSDMTSFSSMGPILNIDTPQHGSDSEAEEEFLHQFNLSKNSKALPVKENTFKILPFTRSNLKTKTKSGFARRNEPAKKISLENVGESRSPNSKSQKVKAKKRKIESKASSAATSSKTFKILNKDGKNTVLPVNEVAGLCAVCCVAYTSSEEQKAHLADPEHIIKVEAKKGTDQKILKKEQKLFSKIKMPTECQHCYKTIELKNELLIHHRRHTNSHPFNCIRCSMSFSRNGDLLSHLRNHTGHHAFQCTVCMKRLASKAKLESHLIAKHGHQDTRTRNFKCTECNEAFISKHEVNRHMNSHTGFRPIKCFVCGHGFAGSHALKVHQRVHSDEKPFECSVCKFKTRSLQLLNRHKRTHTGEKKFQCTICDYASGSSGGLKRHLIIHSGSKPFKCPYCKYKCSNIENLRKHVKQTKKHDGLKVYPCQHCDYSSDDRFLFVKHVKQLHLPYLDEENESAAKLSGILITDEELGGQQSDICSTSSQTKDKMLSQSAEKEPPLCELDSEISDRRETNLYDSLAENSDYNVPHQALSFEIQEEGLPDKQSFFQQPTDFNKNSGHFEIRHDGYRIPQISSMYNPQQQKIAPVIGGSSVVNGQKNDLNARDFAQVKTSEYKFRESEITEQESVQEHAHKPHTVFVEKVDSEKDMNEQQDSCNSTQDSNLNADLLSALITIPNLQKVILAEENGNGPVTLVIGGASSGDQSTTTNVQQHSNNADSSSCNPETSLNNSKTATTKNLEDQKHYQYVISSGGIHLYPT